MKRIISLLAAVLFATGLHAAESARKPNIIFSLADDLGYGDIGPFGQKIIHTPTLDKLAANGMKFTQHYAGCPVCAPSRCVLMTGLHPDHALRRANGSKDGLLPLPPFRAVSARYFLPLAAATSAAKSVSCFSIPSPRA